MSIVMEKTGLFRFVCLALLLVTVFAQRRGSQYGVPIGELSNLSHGIGGTVYGVSDDVLFIKGFTYDGSGPDAYFWVGNSSRPSPQGVLIPYPADFDGREPPILKKYERQDVLLKLPNGLKIRDVKWLSVWCRRFTVDFGSVIFPAMLDPPRTRVLSEFKRMSHGLRSGNVTILDSKTLYIPNLHYDGTGSDVFFWAGMGAEPSSQGFKVANEIGSMESLKAYHGEDIEIQLPNDLTIYDIDWLAVWSTQARENFGHVMIPKDLDVPPALGQNKLTPAWWYHPTPAPSRNKNDHDNHDGHSHELESCLELLGGNLQVQWEADIDGVLIRLSARMAESEYMAFGISGAEGRAQMVGGDVTVAYYNRDDNTFHAEDYYLGAKAQCDGSNGVCPDTRVGGKNDVLFLAGERKNGITTVVFRRALNSNSNPERYDRTIPTVGKVNVIAAIGPLNSNKQANYHGASRTSDDIRLDFMDRNVKKCPVLLAPQDLHTTQPPTRTEPGHDHDHDHDHGNKMYKPWERTVIRGTKAFGARIGPTGGKKGYTAITGQPSWGIAWYINDMLIPEIEVERGQTYNFIVEGGSDSTNSARYHPFYITDSVEGGFGQKTAEQQRRQKVYAGIAHDSSGFAFPTAAGRLCEYKHQSNDAWEESETFADYRRTLRLECDDGKPANLTWTVPMDAPNTLYYQCYTHNGLGWKINVVNSSGKSSATSWARASTAFIGVLALVFVLV